MITKGDQIYENAESCLKEAQPILNKYYNKEILISYSWMLLDRRLKSSKYEERGWLVDALYLKEKLVNSLILDFENIF